MLKARKGMPEHQKLGIDLDIEMNSRQASSLSKIGHPRMRLLRLKTAAIPAAGCPPKQAPAYGPDVYRS